MRLVPAPEEQKWLTRNLRKLVAKCGFERFVCAPIVEPTRRFFPELWSGSVHDVHIVTQRLMHMAGLGEFGVHMTMYGRSEYGHAVGWFNGFEGDRCSFGVEISQMRDPEAAAGVMAHEVAHAWRHHEAVRAPSRDKEEFLTDVTTVYLGFGILTANNTDRYRSSGNWSETRWSTSAVGYLPPDAMCFLLALQASARNRRDEIRTIAKHLEPNQQACFEESMRVLNDVDVLQELALPSPETWPARDEIEAIRIEAPDDDEVVAPPEPVVPAKPNENRVAAAVPQGNRGLMTTLGIIQGAAGGLVLCAILQATDGLAALALVTAGAIVGIIVGGWRSKILVCSACRATLTSEDGMCEKCGATIGAPAAADDADEDCPDCAPEDPCAKHEVVPDEINVA